jgi:hypothetical protein
MTYYDWQITHFEVMSWVSRQARILIHQRDSKVGSLPEFWQSSHSRPNYSSKTSIKPKWIPIELPRSSYSEDSWQAGKSSGPQNLAFLSSLQRMNMGALYVAKPHFLHTFCREEYRGIYRGLSWFFGRKWGSGGSLVRPANQLGWLGNQISWLHWLWALHAPCTDLPWHITKAEFEKAPTPGRPIKEVGPAGPTLARLGPDFVPHHPLVSYSLWLCLILDMLKICMDFGPYDAFSLSDVPEKVDQHNLWNSLVISTYLLHLEWNVGLLVVNIGILWRPTFPHT